MDLAKDNVPVIEESFQMIKDIAGRKMTKRLKTIKEMKDNRYGRSQ